GSRFGPDAIIAASEHLELFDEELGAEFHECGIATLDALAPSAGGPQAMHQDVVAYAGRVVRDGQIPLALGGEHGITAGLVRAVAGKFENLSVLQIDAHTDLRNEFEGSAFSHAAVMRRVLEYVEVIVPVGIRSFSSEERIFMDEADLSPVTARQCHFEPGWIDAVIERLTDDVYISIDIDAFDPAVAPGTGTPEPGGLDWYQVTSLLRRVAGERRIVGADVVEVMPIPGQSVTEYLAARLVYKLICYIQAGERT
ncbi:MAG: agmatinase, partial [bacterium]|nr:agmatinase [bacterium]